MVTIEKEKKALAYYNENRIEGYPTAEELILKYDAWIPMIPVDFKAEHALKVKVSLSDIQSEVMKYADDDSAHVEVYYTGAGTDALVIVRHEDIDEWLYRVKNCLEDVYRYSRRRFARSLSEHMFLDNHNEFRNYRPTCLGEHKVIEYQLHDENI